VSAVLGLLVVAVTATVVLLAATLFNGPSSNHVESKPVPSVVVPPQSTPATITVTAPPPPPTVTVTALPPAPPPAPTTVISQPQGTNYDFLTCPSGRDGVATSVTSCEFADNVRRAYLDQGGPVVMAYSPVTGNVYNMQCVSGFTAHMNNGLVVDAVRCVGGNNAVVVLW